MERSEPWMKIMVRLERARTWRSYNVCKRLAGRLEPEVQLSLVDSFIGARRRLESRRVRKTSQPVLEGRAA